MPITSFMIPLNNRQEGPHELLELILKLHAPSLPDSERHELITQIAALFTTLSNTMGVIGWSEGVKDYEAKHKGKSVSDDVKKVFEAKEVLITQLRSEVAFLRDVIRRGQENAGQNPDNALLYPAEDNVREQNESEPLSSDTGNDK